MSEVVIIAALEREIAGLVKTWRRVKRDFGTRHYEFFESEKTVLVCGGIGAEAARRATEAGIALYQPRELVSVGFAGALQDGMHVGDVLEPAVVIDARDGSHWASKVGGSGVLISFAAVASKEQKSKLARAYSAQAVDMEAASVAKGAQAHGLRFRAIKVVSDELGFAIPSMERFVTHEGRFRSAAFAMSTALHPGMWPTVFQLARNSKRASRILCEYLAVLLGAQQNLAGVDVQNRL
jgi:adenosylhomocysteine nucleosidase